MCVCANICMDACMHLCTTVRPHSRTHMHVWYTIHRYVENLLLGAPSFLQLVHLQVQQCPVRCAVGSFQTFLSGLTIFQALQIQTVRRFAGGRKCCQNEGSTLVADLCPLAHRQEATSSEQCCTSPLSAPMASSSAHILDGKVGRKVMHAPTQGGVQGASIGAHESIQALLGP